MTHIGNFLAWPNDSGVTGGSLAFLAGVGPLWRMVNCHQKGCWRLGHHYKGTVVCHGHRPGES